MKIIEKGKPYHLVDFGNYQNKKLRDRHTTIKNRMRSQATIFSAEEEAIIKAIYISKGK
jgi:hypothetical protein